MIRRRKSTFARDALIEIVKLTVMASVSLLVGSTVSIAVILAVAR